MAYPSPVSLTSAPIRTASPSRPSRSSVWTSRCIPFGGALPTTCTLSGPSPSGGSSVANSPFSPRCSDTGQPVTADQYASTAGASVASVSRNAVSQKTVTTGTVLVTGSVYA